MVVLVLLGWGTSARYRLSPGIMAEPAPRYKPLAECVGKCVLDRPQETGFAEEPVTDKNLDRHNAPDLSVDADRFQKLAANPPKSGHLDRFDLLVGLGNRRQWSWAPGVRIRCFDGARTEPSASIMPVTVPDCSGVPFDGTASGVPRMGRFLTGLVIGMRLRDNDAGCLTAPTTSPKCFLGQRAINNWISGSK